MNRNRSIAAVICVLSGLSAVSLVVHAALAQIPVVTKNDGHMSPVRAEITLPDGNKSVVMVVEGGDGPFKFWNRDPVTGSDVRLWVDTIHEIRDITENDALFVLKDGTERRLKCNQFGPITIKVARQDGSQEYIAINKLDKLEFLKAPRMDKQGRAMFDQWVYSPYTGEKLPDLKPDRTLIGK